MKVIITGSRTITNKDIVFALIDHIINIELKGPIIINEIVSGTANGVDKLGEEWANKHNIVVKQFPAYWKEYGKMAGYIRNEEMVKYADFAIILWDGKSRGTNNTINLMIKYNKPYELRTINVD